MTLSLVPRPTSLTETEHRLRLTDQVAVSAPAEAVSLLNSLLGAGTGLVFLAADGDATVTITTDADQPAGGYTLAVTDTGIAVTHGDQAGLIHAITTLHQLLPAWTHGRSPLPGATIEVPGVEISDAPALGWRGVHLDVGRHYLPLNFLYDFVDALALHKINIFHLHLTEDQGWRFEVKKYPKLTEIGAVRSGTKFPDWDTSDGIPHGGYYTQEQLKALVGFARQRGITVVPEIDLPGHTMSLLAAYPEFGEPEADPVEVAEYFGVMPQVLHLSDTTVAMTEDILTELLEVFDSPWIHIGGDECPRDQWQASQEAKELAYDRDLESVDHLQRWYTEHLRGWLAERGRTLVGWDEIIDEAAVEGAVVMSWRGTEPGLRALAAGNEVVMAPNNPLYFDYYQSESRSEPRAIGGHAPLSAVIAYDPYEGIPDDQRGLLLGIQGQLWTEYMIDSRRVEYMAFPRIAALAEVAWHAGPAEAAEFESRLTGHLERLDARGINYRPLAGPLPWQVGGGKYQRI